MLRVGIITHYYDSNNYGGMLQAYSLVKCLEKLGFNVEQICYFTENVTSVSQKTIRSFIKSISVDIIKKGLNMRKDAFKKFEKNIPHSSIVYNSNNICCAIDEYDAFITGSDQVWSFKWFVSSYFLDFVPSSKIKIAYAASMGASSLNDKCSEQLRQYISDYNAISLRERDSTEFVQQLTDKRVVTTIDPTLLLDIDEWKKISEKKVIHENYIFCYFLGNDRSIRKLAKQFSKEKGLKIVCLPNLQQHLEINDIFFGNEKLYNIGPEDFVSLIRNAEYVLTDSFHATVFSSIFRKKYIVFGRNGAEAMNNRIINLLDMFGNSNRFFINPQSIKLQDVCLVADEKLIYDYRKLNVMKKKSIDFLVNSLKVEL